MFDRLRWCHYSFLLLDFFRMSVDIDLPEHLNIPRYRCDKLTSWILLNIETSFDLIDCNALYCRKSPLATWLLYCATDVSEYTYQFHSILAHAQYQSHDTVAVTADYILHLRNVEGGIHMGIHFKWLSAGVTEQNQGNISHDK